VKSIEDAQKIFRSGADKVGLNSGALQAPHLIRQISDLYGSQATVLSVEAKKMSNNRWNAFFNGGRQDSTRNVLEWIEEAVALGAGEILVTSVDRDGTGRGFDRDLVSIIEPGLGVPLVISGGAASEEDVLQLLSDYTVDGVAIGMSLHKNVFSLESLRESLINGGMNLRQLQ
jgi:cyclase